MSLCVIAGNVEQYIGRFLDQFGPLADEICVVRACGSLQPDSTMDSCADAGCVIGAYYNQGHPARGPHDWDKSNPRGLWPHVDDYAAARQTACDMATGDWLMWADTDDTITPESVSQIRRLLDDIGDADIQGIQMRYVVPEDNVINWRERIWRRGTARWQFPVHECLKFNDGAKMMRFEGAEIVHAAGKRNPLKDERNLRILESIPEAERGISQHFHIFQALIALGRNAEAIEKAIEFCQMPDVGKPELYEAYFQLARLATDPTDKHRMLLQAVASDSTRREAYGELGLSSLPHDPQCADGWTRAMMGHQMPTDPPWNLRRQYYGQLGVALRGMALRANGRTLEADALETNHFVRSGARISLLHATRGRPAMAWKQRMDWLQQAENPDAIEHIFGIDYDDEQSAPLAIARHVLVPAGGGSVAAWNACAKASRGEVLVQMSDDFAPFPAWDTAILSAIGDTSRPAVLAVSDGARKDDLLCMAILTRRRYQDQGYLFHPDFFSVYSDNWFSHCAFRDGVVIDARDRITFEHMHPVFGKATTDATYERGNSGPAYAIGKAVFDRLTNEENENNRNVQGMQVVENVSESTNDMRMQSK